MNDDSITVVVKRVGEPAKAETIKDDFRVLQEIVGGVFQMPSMPGMKNVNLVCNDVGKLENLPANIYWGDDDIICGNCLIIGHDDEGESISLTPEQIERALKYMNENDASGFTGNVIDYAKTAIVAFDNGDDFLKALFGDGADADDKPEM
jgi:hypothetical protein